MFLEWETWPLVARDCAKLWSEIGDKLKMGSNCCKTANGNDKIYSAVSSNSSVYLKRYFLRLRSFNVRRCLSFNFETEASWIDFEIGSHFEAADLSEKFIMCLTKFERFFTAFLRLLTRNRFSKLIWIERRNVNFEMSIFEWFIEICFEYGAICSASLGEIGNLQWSFGLLRFIN